MEIKGFNTSTDYEKLYNLANNGYRIPAWLLYSDEYETPIFDIVEVKKSTLARYIGIGTRGRGYETFDESKEAFIKNCECLQLKFILPNEKI
jgi:hypothetical protein